MLLKPYSDLIRWKQPIGTYLLFLPSVWGVLYGYQAQSILSTGSIITLLAIGSFLMRSAGCIINDYCDRDIDIHVERTRQRPLANGTLLPKQALIILAIFLFLAAQTLWFLPLDAIYLCCFSVILVALYPLMKRVTYWPQIFLGITFNIGIIVGYITIKGAFSFEIVSLYLVGVLHTIGYDTIYAFCDIKDDPLIGVKSSAQKVKKHPKYFIGLCYGSLIGILSFYISWIGGISLGIFMIYTVWKWNPNCPQNSLKAFYMAHYQNIFIAGIIFFRVSFL